MGCKNICCSSDKKGDGEETIEENLARLEVSISI